MIDARVSVVLDRWTARCGLTRAEREIVMLATFGPTRAEIARARCVAPSTLKKQVQSICSKTGERLLVWVALRVLLEAIYSSEIK